MSTPSTRLRELRLRAGKSQAQLAAALYITRSAYSKLEREKTEMTLKRAKQIAQILRVMPSDLLSLPTPDPEQVGIPAAELLYLRAGAEHRVLDAFLQASSDQQEPVPFAELAEHDWDYLTLCGISTREEYEAAGVLITRSTPEGDELAFEQMLRNADIYGLFHHGIIQDEHLLGFWQAFLAKGTPYFEFENKPFGELTKRLFPDVPDFLDPDSESASDFEAEAPVESPEADWPPRPMYQPGQPLEAFIAELRDYNAAAHTAYTAKYSPQEIQQQIDALPPVNWVEVVQQSTARSLARDLDELVYQELDPVFAHLRNDPAEYARTLARLTGLAWILESLTEEQSPVDVLSEEIARLKGKPYSAEFQLACEQFVQQYRVAA